MANHKNPIANLQGSKPFSKVGARDFSSLEALAKRKRKKGGRPVNPTTKTAAETLEIRKTNQRSRAQQTVLAIEARKQEKTTYLTQGDVVGSYVVEEVNHDRTRVTAVCICGKREVKSATSILTIDTCKHRQSNGAKHDTVRAKFLYRAMFQAWRRINDECVARGVSMVPRWQDFRAFCQFGLCRDRGWSSGYTLARVYDPEYFKEERPDYYRWVSSGTRRSHNHLGFITVEIDGKLESLNALALDCKISLAQLSKLRRDHGVSDLGLLHFVQEVKAKQ
ncbi:hypothetical protein vBVhaSVHB1_101 [Vibrio phage vB_VhaS-VHB1]|nr:hypothetical protein vBVhaSVHB1_101 [Vibrio phage vB_VhaS-VHB1]